MECGPIVVALIIACTVAFIAICITGYNIFADLLRRKTYKEEQERELLRQSEESRE